MISTLVQIRLVEAKVLFFWLHSVPCKHAHEEVRCLLLTLTCYCTIANQRNPTKGGQVRLVRHECMAHYRHASTPWLPLLQHDVTTTQVSIELGHSHTDLSTLNTAHPRPTDQMTGRVYAGQRYGSIDHDGQIERAESSSWRRCTR
jgi:hypothetical protein